MVLVMVMVPMGSVVLAGQVAAPVRSEVAVADEAEECAQLEDSAGAVALPAGQLRGGGPLFDGLIRLTGLATSAASTTASVMPAQKVPREGAPPGPAWSVDRDEAPVEVGEG
ncbi:hypothetical protein F9278_45530 [Streptomyces phaeolivaceus]|uniref:Uncharacterized protein n=1 Tax=Streptomyces phaeolivaceus TaxID=2653200 RepID=A0A5P8KI69_9ACTN|nr:hypothetical protein [Streptomyces phaeolivaceus]QFR02210.1 hypothetical protein F9278_45530 [Streptomyces phaeolivaceus]